MALDLPHPLWRTWSDLDHDFRRPLRNRTKLAADRGRALRNGSRSTLLENASGSSSLPWAPFEQTRRAGPPGRRRDGPFVEERRAPIDEQAVDVFLALPAH